MYDLGEGNGPWVSCFTIYMYAVTALEVDLLIKSCNSSFHIGIIYFCKSYHPWNLEELSLLERRGIEAFLSAFQAFYSHFCSYFIRIFFNVLHQKDTLQTLVCV
jgi:hypothetical protein